MNNDLGTVIRTFLPELLKKRGLTKHQLKVLDALANCRTENMGGSALACRECGSIHYVLNSCRNRHCPRCQGIDKELWIEARSRELLPVKYFHVVFTVPHSLLELFRYNREVMYNLLFEKAWETLCLFANRKKQQLGAIAILHTWDQQLKFHPHVHLIVPAGGIDKEGVWQHSKRNGKSLFDVKALSKKFSARFVSKLRKLKKQGLIQKHVPRDLIKTPWVVFTKQAFGSPHSIVEYLARYTHRVAISNARILNVTETHVTFTWKNRKKGYSTEVETITGVDFLKRFVEHIIPPYFRRIRHYGFLGSRNKKQTLLNLMQQLMPGFEPAAQLSRAQILALRFGERSVLRCRHCGGLMILHEVFQKQRAPPV